MSCLLAKKKVARTEEKTRWIKKTLTLARRGLEMRRGVMRSVCSVSLVDWVLLARDADSWLGMGCSRIAIRRCGHVSE